MPARTLLPPLDNETLAYTAGLIDGEGTITIVKRKTSRNKTILEYSGMAQLAQRDREILDWVRETFGIGSVVLQRRATYQMNDLHHWVVQAHAAYLFVQAIRPWLRVKARQADLLLAYQEAKIAWTNQRQRIGHKGTVPTPQSLIDQYQYWLESVQSINRKGWVNPPGGHWNEDGTSVANGAHSGP